MDMAIALGLHKYNLHAKLPSIITDHFCILVIKLPLSYLLQ